MRSSRELTVVAAALVLVACGGGAPSAAPAAEPSDAGADADADRAPAKELGERACPPKSALTYDSFGAPFFATWCSGCHGGDLPDDARRGAPRAVTFDDLAQIRPLAARIWLRAGDTNVAMPPSGGPSARDRADLGEWLACGAR